MVVNKNAYLTRAEMTENAQYLMNHFLMDGWTAESIAGILGNMETESTINPGIWQNLESYANNPYTYVAGHGFGLVQWTPFNKYTTWARDNGMNYDDIDSEIARINYEIANGIQWIETSEFPITFNQFKTNSVGWTVEKLAESFLINYERPADQGQEQRNTRRTQARYWYDNLNKSGCDFIYPSEVTRITSGFQPPDRPDHNGIDFAADGYHEIWASADGTVSRSYLSSTYGEVVFIESTIDGQLYETVYAHMRSGSRTVQQGDTVAQGQMIGVMGNTGESTGQHLHFELHVGQWNQTKSNAVDPLLYLCSPGGGDGTPPEDGGDNQKSKDDLIVLLLSDALNGLNY